MTSDSRRSLKSSAELSTSKQKRPGNLPLTRDLPPNVYWTDGKRSLYVKVKINGQNKYQGGFHSPEEASKAAEILKRLRRPRSFISIAPTHNKLNPFRLRTYNPITQQYLHEGYYPTLDAAWEKARELKSNGLG